jgi:DNA-binding Lrp family transcriptional regulator
MPEKFREVLSRLGKIEEISELYATSGDHVAIFVAVVPSQRVNSFISGIERIEGIRKVYPSLVQEVLK